MSAIPQVVWMLFLQLAVYAIAARIIFLLFIEKELRQNQGGGDEIPSHSPVTDFFSHIRGATRSTLRFGWGAKNGRAPHRRIT